MFKELLEQQSTKENSKGGLYYSTSYDYNLDLFTLATRYKDEAELINLFDNAYNENPKIAIANLLHILDIRGGKGERRVFKILFNHLCKKDIDYAKKVLYVIPELGRYDYILQTANTALWSCTIEIIKSQLKADLNSDSISLLAKWLPSVRTHNKNNPLANKIAKDLNISIKEYRQTLSKLRNKIDIVEHHISNKEYDNIKYEAVPSVAMYYYYNLFLEYDKDRFNAYIKSVKDGKNKINASVLEPYQIIKHALVLNLDVDIDVDIDENIGVDIDEDILNTLWDNQTNVLTNEGKNALVIADTSGSMFLDGMLPISCALGLAIYIAERNKGIFHNTFINFSNEPTFQKLTGNNLIEKLNSINFDNWGESTNIDKALEMILNASISSPMDECPTQLIIISDMEFDCSIKKTPNFKHWQNKYQENNIKMPKIIFWCVSPQQDGLPITKNDDNCCIISGFSPKIFKDILEIKNFTPSNVMLEVLQKYFKYFE